jgi:hypothetical protein
MERESHTSGDGVASTSTARLGLALAFELGHRGSPQLLEFANAIDVSKERATLRLAFGGFVGGREYDLQHVALRAVVTVPVQAPAVTALALSARQVDLSTH